VANLQLHRVSFDLSDGIDAWCPICQEYVRIDLRKLTRAERGVFISYVERSGLYSTYLTRQQLRAAGASLNGATVASLVRKLQSIYQLPIKIEYEKAGVRIRFPKVKAHSHL